MGWSSGTEVMTQIIEYTMENIASSRTRHVFYLGVIEALESADWDCQQECEEIDTAFDAALRELHPDWYEGTDI